MMWEYFRLMARRRGSDTSTAVGMPERITDAVLCSRASFQEFSSHRWATPFFFFIVVVVVCLSCRRPVPPNPWGASAAADSTSCRSVAGIVAGGELILVTLYGPTTYYEYHGRFLGLHYLLCEQYCRSLGVALRVDVCRDSAELVRRLVEGSADVAALSSSSAGVTLCGDSSATYAVAADNASLLSSLSSFLTVENISAVSSREAYYLSSASVRRRDYSAVKDARRGVFSSYDALFRRYASVAGWDWRLLAAQCYQESTFDPHARSWDGACGLMQIMPSTADHLHLARADLFDPEKNISAAARYISELSQLFSDVRDRHERIKFVLAAYNGGAFHIRDAQRLTKKYGGDDKRWEDVRRYVLLLSDSKYYRDSVVEYGYMRGGETTAYVDHILRRWDNYRGARRLPR